MFRDRQQFDQLRAALTELGADFIKLAGDPQVAYAMSGRLYLSASGFLLLGVPNALVRGAFQALDEPGISLPPGIDGKLDAHVTVMHPSEIAKIGGPDKIKERGQTFSYRLGGLETVEPDGWKEIERVWALRVFSPDLQELRQSYGLSGLPREGKYAFHLTIAVRGKGVLARNEKSRASSQALDLWKS